MPDLFQTVLYVPTGVLIAPIALPAVLQRFQCAFLGRFDYDIDACFMQSFWSDVGHGYCTVFTHQS